MAEPGGTGLGLGLGLRLGLGLGLRLGLATEFPGDRISCDTGCYDARGNTAYN